ncbi:ABC transporter ATP-binding protein [Brevibacterium sp. 50QC2O2]|uniref:ABC transporter ATP-binding protein n=1 Tax=Brevibacterium sp. 50QC2O2 TaxID=2968459 RepID=UPI00211BA991|nr:ABC transporter ATP-binding protein [Brevibacterium sp. 50QC2O2]MCQ9389749.1 ABC transporter ATP-binding protein [Brevibacterium sp. 50QC2O2]
MATVEIENLCVGFDTPRNPGDYAPVVKNVSLRIDEGEIFGLVGESGSGKSVTGLAVMGLHDQRRSRITGSVKVGGVELLDAEHTVQAQYRGTRVSMVFQEPMTALDPVFTIGQQLTETLRAHRRISRAEAKRQSLDMLDRVGIPDPAGRFGAYPHELSGGMRQRVVIAIALLCGPTLLIADEPTTAVDATVQLQLLRLIKDMCAEFGTAVLFITHDLGVVNQLCDRVATMYAGEIVETGPVKQVLAAPAHPYTGALLNALPRFETRGMHLQTLPGRVPPPGQEGQGCWFAERCAFAAEACRGAHPELLPVPGTPPGTSAEAPTGSADTQPRAARMTRCVRVGQIDPLARPQEVEHV